MQRLDGKVSVITGGAGGIGAATTRLFVAEGSRVIIADVLEERGKRLAEELGDVAVFVRTDVSHEDEIKAAIDVAVERFGRLDCLFNNAGFGGVSGMIEETDTAELDATLAVLLRAVVLGMKHAAPVMKRQGSGTIISTASVAGINTGFGPHIYSTCKAALIHLTCSVAKELGESGIRVNCICPGGIVTPIFGRGLGLSEQEIDEKLPALNGPLSLLQPIRRAGQPEDIARAALWLAGEESSFVSGHALVVDGALTMGRGWSESQVTGEAIRTLFGVDPP
jgi:NAD(P)-dependent dehydrogenase (short-subunit alcohol dehydrogenase family)